MNSLSNEEGYHRYTNINVTDRTGLFVIFPVIHTVLNEMVGTDCGGGHLEKKLL